MQKRCLRCGYTYENEDVDICRNCGYTVFENISIKKTSPERRIFLGLIGVLITLLVISTFIPMYQQNYSSSFNSIIISASEASNIVSGNWAVLVNETGSFIMYNNGTSKLNLLNGSQIMTSLVSTKLVIYPGILVTQGSGAIEKLVSGNSSIIIILYSPQNRDYVNIIYNQLIILNLLNKLNKISNYTYYDPESNTIISIMLSKNSLLVVNAKNLQYNQIFQIYSYVKGKLAS